MFVEFIEGGGRGALFFLKCEAAGSCSNRSMERLASATLDNSLFYSISMRMQANNTTIANNVSRNDNT